MKEITVKAYEFHELSDKAKEAAREWYRTWAFEDKWWDAVYDDARVCASKMGIDIDSIYFRGFSLQGDGACFVGRFEGKTDAEAAIKEYAPKDEWLQKIAVRLSKLSLKYPKLSAKVRQFNSHYSHSYTIELEGACYVITKDEDEFDEELPATDEEELLSCFRSFSDWIYEQLKEEWDYLNSDEQIDEAIEGNEYLFTAAGSREVIL